MLTITNNLDRTDEAAISNWPFTYESTLDTGNGVLTGDSFLAVSVNVDETVALPCRFKGMTADGKLVICDATGAEVCSGQLYERTDPEATTCSFFLYNKYGVLSGFVCCKPSVPTMLWSLSQYANGMHYFATNAFVLLPQCHVQSAVGNVRSFGIEGRYTTANLNIRCTTGEVPETYVPGSTVTGHSIIPEGTEDSPVMFGVFNFDDDPPTNKWCHIVINGSTYNVAGKNLIIKAATASNLRVVQTDAAIILRGVTDAK